MNDTPLISVMIPVFNRADLLADALESVMCQYDEKLLEVWVVDDCSTSDNPQESIARYPKHSIKFFRQPGNVGQVRNLNKCIELANGTLIHLLHCDDKVLPGFYHAIMEASARQPEAGAFFTCYNTINHDGVLLGVSEPLQQRSGYIQNWFEKIATSQLIQTPSIVVKKEVYGKLGGFNEMLTWTEDWEMWVRISKTYPVYYINQVLATYRKANNSNSDDSFKTGRFIWDLKNVIAENFKHHQSAEIRKKSMDFYSEYIITIILRMGQDRRINWKSILNLLVIYCKNKFYITVLFTFLYREMKHIVRKGLSGKN